MTTRPSREALQLADDIHEYLGGNPDEWRDKDNRRVIAEMIEAFVAKRMGETVRVAQAQDPAS